MCKEKRTLAEAPPSASVSLRDVVEAMDLPNEEWQALLDRESNEIVIVTEDEVLGSGESPSPENDFPTGCSGGGHPPLDGLDSEHFLPLPGRFEIHEWSLMERFSRTIEDSEGREELTDAIHGPGAFRLFRTAAKRLGLLERWYAYRQAAFEEIAKDWLETHEVPYR